MVLAGGGNVRRNNRGGRWRGLGKADSAGCAVCVKFSSCPGRVVPILADSRKHCLPGGRWSVGGTRRCFHRSHRVEPPDRAHRAAGPPSRIRGACHAEEDSGGLRRSVGRHGGGTRAVADPSGRADPDRDGGVVRRRNEGPDGAAGERRALQPGGAAADARHGRRDGRPRPDDGRGRAGVPAAGRVRPAAVRHAGAGRGAVRRHQPGPLLPGRAVPAALPGEPAGPHPAAHHQRAGRLRPAGVGHHHRPGGQQQPPRPGHGERLPRHRRHVAGRRPPGGAGGERPVPVAHLVLELRPVERPGHPAHRPPVHQPVHRRAGVAGGEQPEQRVRLGPSSGGSRRAPC
jgi:hypothetical protein